MGRFLAAVLFFIAGFLTPVTVAAAAVGESWEAVGTTTVVAILLVMGWSALNDIERGDE